MEAEVHFYRKAELRDIFFSMVREAIDEAGGNESLFRESIGKKFIALRNSGKDLWCGFVSQYGLEGMLKGAKGDDVLCDSCWRVGDTIYGICMKGDYAFPSEEMVCSLFISADGEVVRPSKFVIKDDGVLCVYPDLMRDGRAVFGFSIGDEGDVGITLIPEGSRVMK